MVVMRGSQVWRVAVAAAVVLATAPGCSRTFHAETIQPNPLAHPNETLRQSQPITIVRGDMELDTPAPPEATQRVALIRNNHWPLYNIASFIVVSRDRLRFHLQIDHKWEEWATVSTWKVHLEDDSGRRWEPESVEHVRTKILTTMWDREQRTAVRNDYGDIVALNEDGWKNRQTLGSLSVFRGKGDFVLYQRDLFTPNVRWLKLVVSRPGEAFEFRWRFADVYASQ
jgi:hypothetical protein